MLWIIAVDLILIGLTALSGLGLGQGVQDERLCRARVDLCVYVTPDFQCEVSPTVCAGCSDVDLLFEDSIRKELGLGQETISRIERHRDRYWMRINSRHRPKGQQPNGERDFKNDDSLELDAEIKEVLGYLNAGECRRLSALGRYLYFRQFGPAKFYADYDNHRDDAARRPDVAEIERQARMIWGDTFRRGAEAWKLTLRRIANALPAPTRADFEADRLFFEASVWADITLVELDSPPATTKNDFQDTEDEYVKRLSRQETYRLGLDGQWRRQIVESPEVFKHHFSFLLTYFSHQNDKSQRNDLDISPDQFVKIEELTTEFYREHNALVEERRSWGELGRSSLGKGFFQARQRDLWHAWQQRVWADILLPPQKELLIQLAREMDFKKWGPGRLLADESLSDAAKKTLKDELARFEGELSAIEIELLERLRALLPTSDNAPELDLAARPQYLKPSLMLIELNAGKKHP